MAQDTTGCAHFLHESQGAYFWSSTLSVVEVRMDRTLYGYYTDHTFMTNIAQSIECIIDVMVDVQKRKYEGTLWAIFLFIHSSCPFM
jgi:hypothetical protein